MLLALLYTGWLLVWQLFGVTPVAGWWPYRLVSLFDIWFFLPLPFLLLYAWTRRHLPAVIVLCLPLVLFASEFGDLFVPGAQAVSGRSLRVMTANVLSDNEVPGALGAAILRENPDIVAVQELTPTLAHALEAQLRQRYPHRALYPNEGDPDLGIFSRFPLHVVTADRFRVDACPCQQVTVELAGRVITLLNVHPTRPIVSTGRLGPLPLPKGFDTSRRDRALRAIQARVQGISTPLVVVGDFNTSDRDPAYLPLAGTLHDAFRAAGWGPGYTFPTPNLDQSLLGRGVARLPFFPLVRIDYVFHSDHWTPARAGVVGLPGSDHLAVVADLLPQGDGVAPQTAAGDH